jgi:hypothetical protein
MASDSVVSENVVSGCTISEADTHWPYCGGLGSVPGQLYACGIRRRQSGTGTDFFPSKYILSRLS